MPSTLLAITLYLCATALLLRDLRHSDSAGPTARVKLKPIIVLSLLALGAHAISVGQAVQTPLGVNLGLFKVSSLIFLFINAVFVLSLRWRPLHNLAIILYPLAAIAVLTSALAPGNISPVARFSAGMLLHIASSILAYAVLTVAACQAAALAVQDYQLRHRHTRGLVQILPPLQLMEKMLFEMLWGGLLLLTLAIASGLLFLEDIFAQHLVHKTVLTLGAWLLFALLLWGRQRHGWRSQTAVRFTLSGFAVLMLGYFGSKLVLEVILERV